MHPRSQNLEIQRGKNIWAKKDQKILNCENLPLATDTLADGNVCRMVVADKKQAKMRVLCQSERNQNTHTYIAAPEHHKCQTMLYMQACILGSVLEAEATKIRYSGRSQSVGGTSTS